MVEEFPSYQKCPLCVLENHARTECPHLNDNHHLLQSQSPELVLCLSLEQPSDELTESAAQELPCGVEVVTRKERQKIAAKIVREEVHVISLSSTSS